MTPGAWRIVVQSVAVLALLLLAKLCSALLLPLVCAVLLFMVLSPAAEALQRRGVPDMIAAAALVFVPALGVVALAAWWAPEALAWWRDVGAALAELGQDLEPLAGGAGVAAAGLRWLLSQRAWTDADLASWAVLVAPPATLAAATTLMLAFFLLVAQRSLLAGLLRALPRRRARVQVTAALREARDGVVKFFATMALINLGLGVVTALVVAAIGLPGVLAWAGVIFLLLFIPYLGPLAITLLLAAAGAGRGTAALLAPAAFLLLHGIEAHFISPLVMGRRLRLARPALLVAVIAGAWIGGVAGGVLAVPVLIALHAGLRRAPAPALFNVLLAGEQAGAPSLAESSRGALAPGPRDPAEAAADDPDDADDRHRVRGMPMLVEKDRSTPCASPSSPKPIPPKSTVSR